MQELTPVGLSKDGTRLVLASATGEQYAVRADARLRATLRGDDPRLGQLEMKMESALRPRDIQARIRAGESPEDVATAAQTSVEAIMGFATPVLAERAHVAQTAQKASVRRRSGESSSAGRTLGEASELFFGDHGLHDEDVEWDAWRRPDGRWALVATYALGERARTAEFTHDLPGRYVVAENDEARILTGELREPDAAPGATRTVQARRLSAVPAQDELPLGDDAIELVREPAADEPTEPSLLPDAITDEQRDAGPGGEVETEPLLEADLEPLRPADEALVEVEELSPTPAADDATSPLAESEPLPDAVEGEAEEPAPPPRKKSRSSVPSWDEIMFGGKND